MKKVHLVCFEENGGEYYGELKITCHSLAKIGNRILIADGVEIEIDENIDGEIIVEEIK